MDAFAGDREGLSRGGQDAHILRCCEDGIRQRRYRLDDMFAVIEDEQQLLAFERERDRLIHPAIRLLVHPQRLRGDAGDEFEIADRGQVDKPHAVGIAIEQLCTDLQREPRLADTAGATSVSRR